MYILNPRANGDLNFNSANLWAETGPCRCKYCAP